MGWSCNVVNWWVAWIRSSRTMKCLANEVVQDKSSQADQSNRITNDEWMWPIDEEFTRIDELEYESKRKWKKAVMTVTRWRRKARMKRKIWYGTVQYWQMPRLKSGVTSLPWHYSPLALQSSCSHDIDNKTIMGVNNLKSSSTCFPWIDTSNIIIRFT